MRGCTRMYNELDLASLTYVVHECSTGPDEQKERNLDEQKEEEVQEGLAIREISFRSRPRRQGMPTAADLTGTPKCYSHRPGSTMYHAAALHAKANAAFLSSIIISGISPP